MRSVRTFSYLKTRTYSLSDVSKRGRRGDSPGAWRRQDLRGVLEIRVRGCNLQAHSDLRRAATIKDGCQKRKPARYWNSAPSRDREIPSFPRSARSKTQRVLERKMGPPAVAYKTRVDCPRNPGSGAHVLYEVELAGPLSETAGAASRHRRAPATASSCGSCDTPPSSAGRRALARPGGRRTYGAPDRRRRPRSSRGR